MFLVGDFNYQILELDVLRLSRQTSYKQMKKKVPWFLLVRLGSHFVCLVIISHYRDYTIISSSFLSSSFSSELSDEFESLRSCTPGNHLELSNEEDLSIPLSKHVRSFWPSEQRWNHYCLADWYQPHWPATIWPTLWIHIEQHNAKQSDLACHRLSN